NSQVVGKQALLDPELLLHYAHLLGPVAPQQFDYRQPCLVGEGLQSLSTIAGRIGGIHSEQSPSCVATDAVNLYEFPFMSIRSNSVRVSLAERRLKRNSQPLSRPARQIRPAPRKIPL